MYEKLVMRLRKCASDKNADCAGCPYQGGYKGTYCINGLITEAADAIEGLAKALERSKEWESFWEEEANEALRKFQVSVASKPRWIPVTETKKLPKDGQPVFIHIPARFRKTVSIPMIAYRDQGTWREQETHRDVYNMTHWMPLPEPPKEKTE